MTTIGFSNVSLSNICVLNGDTIAPFDMLGLLGSTVWDFTVPSVGPIGLDLFRGRSITDLFTFSNFTFTNLGATGRAGPTSLSGYNSNLYPFVANSSFLSLSGGMQLWTVPADGTYAFTVAGAAGGTSTAAGGRGIILTSSSQLTKGHVLKILVGQMGQGFKAGTGGGGTFVYNNTSLNLLFAAGGGGGGGMIVNAGTVEAGRDAVITTSGTADTSGLCAGGTNGNGGFAVDGDGNSSAGGGYLTNGSNVIFSGGTIFGGNSFMNGGLGSSTISGLNNGEGGFGGGGNVYNNGAGGGGYSGGGGGGGYSFSPNYQSGGGGGGSYGVSVITNAGYNISNGYVTIEKVIVYPPVALTSAADTNLNGINASQTVSGQLYGNGAYSVTASSYYIPDNNAYPWQVFDASDGTGTAWTPGGTFYMGTGGLYSGTVTTTVSGSSVAGEWIQIKLPEAIVLRYYYLHTWLELSRFPISFVLAGSTNGSTWTTIDSKTGIATTANVSAGSGRFFSVSTLPSAYQYFRFIALSTAGNGWLSISSLRLYT